MAKLIFVTGNKNKLEEARMILKNHDVVNENINLLELQGSAEEIVLAKAKLAFEKLGVPCFVEDTSLSFDAWNGLPGPYIKDFLKFVGVEKLPSLLDGQELSAEAVSSIGFARSKSEIFCFQGRVRGKIVSVGGSDRFEWDRIFMPKGFDKRFSEMTINEKNTISHRRRAFEKFNEFLD
ncbi:MAG: RdgB/HAM1 family non-canonical purine NTP pyrophosphatase [Nanoarchaeota archaeon]|nr:RdgB/HAM1 family non-canonical purine NTP pyrophosphatase [Nanoarchaeota archaeon]MBU1849472.1 RdgB/HAM1 family non-canonical purine NTP pyrophosphatase [Nanoarchaeota archaeon]